jgi:hypothetical protein
VRKIKQIGRFFAGRLWLRVVGGVFLVLLGIVLGPLPGPGLLVSASGLVVLGLTADDLVRWGRKVIPGFDERKAESVLQHPAVRPFRKKRWVSLLGKGRAKDGEEEKGRTG